ncbi:MAG TPA: hypothetical protein VGM37_00200 [Armatimonadota bacterium]|jgi:hypothetical protein
MQFKSPCGLAVAMAAMMAGVTVGGARCASPEEPISADVSISLAPPASGSAPLLTQKGNSLTLSQAGSPPITIDLPDVAAQLKILDDLPHMIADAAPELYEAAPPGSDAGARAHALAKVEAEMKAIGAPLGRDSSLQRNVDIQLKNAPIRQVAESLTRSTGIHVSVSEGVSKEARVNLEARHVPLSTVLEGIARQADLIISREDDGVSLGAWPSLTVNGVSTRYKVRNAPWSDDWLIPPTTFFGGEAGSMPWVLTPRSAGSMQTTMPGAALGMGFGGRPDGGRVSVAALGDRLIVAEPGENETGDEGVWLTVYRLSGDDLQQVSQMFQKSRAPAAGVRTLTLSTRGKFESNPDARPNPKRPDTKP